jgi:hypothetical protein
LDISVEGTLPGEEYTIDLGLMKDGKPHWLNGKTLAEAYNDINPINKRSKLVDSYDYYKNNKFRNSAIDQFLKNAEAFIKKQK